LPAGSEAIQADLGNESAIKELFGKLGRFDHLVYTAGENISLSMIGDTDLGDCPEIFQHTVLGRPSPPSNMAGTSINAGGSICLTVAPPAPVPVQAGHGRQHLWSDGRIYRRHGRRAGSDPGECSGAGCRADESVEQPAGRRPAKPLY